MGDTALAMRDVSLRFGGVRALADVSLEVERGEVVAVIGPNGAGKTSLINAVTGFYRPTSGEVLVNGVSCVGQRPHKIAARGVARTFQTPHLAPDLSALGNLLPAFCRTQRLLAPRAGRLSFDEIHGRCMEALERTGLKGREHDLASILSLGEQRRLELARACVTSPSILFLDEVASGLAEVEAETIVPAIRQMARDLGSAVVLVEHSMSFVRATADRVVVLVKGEVVAHGGVEETLSNATVIESYLGTAT